MSAAMTKDSVSLWLATLAFGLLSGCASSVPAPVLLTLPAAVDATQAVAAPPAASAPVLVVRRLGVPEYISARRVRFRADPSTLAEWPNTFWAERVEIGLNREFVSALRQQLPNWTICDASCDDQLPVLSLQVDISPLDFMRASQQLQARARIAVSTARGTPRLLSAIEHGYALNAGGDTPQAQAQATTDLLKAVAALAAPEVTAARP